MSCKKFTWFTVLADIGIDSLADRLATLKAQCTISESGPSLEIRSCQKVISSLVQGMVEIF